MDCSTRRLRKPGAVLLWSFLVPALLAGCGPSSAEKETAGRSSSQASSALDAEWAWLQKTKATLDGQRARLAADPKLARETEALALEFDRRLVEFINAEPPVQGEPASERQKAALRMKSDEDILLARQFIEQGGDYQRAIDIYKEALAVDPGNPRLREELARAQARRYMTRETFEQAKEGMVQEEVRALLGQPNLHNVREYPDRGVVGWFYPKDASGRAAAVWFHEEGGQATAYLLDFDALEPRAPNAPDTATPPPVPARQRST
jgi:tetratricopeptide (TPR) repeat protein